MQVEEALVHNQSFDKSKILNLKLEILFHPISYKNIGIPGAPVISVAAKNNFLPVGGKHREGIENLFMAYFLQVAAILIDRVKIEREAPFIFLVTGYHYGFLN